MAFAKEFFIRQEIGPEEDKLRAFLEDTLGYKRVGDRNYVDPVTKQVYLYVPKLVFAPWDQAYTNPDKGEYPPLGVFIIAREPLLLGCRDLELDQVHAEPMLFTNRSYVSSVFSNVFPDSEFSDLPTVQAFFMTLKYLQDTFGPAFYKHFVIYMPGEYCQKKVIKYVVSEEDKMCSIKEYQRKPNNLPGLCARPYLNSRWLPCS